MSNLQPETPTQTKPSTREGEWAKPVKRLDSSQVKADINLNVDGKEIASPIQGFGQMWQKTYHITLKGAQVTPQELIQAWKENFGKFWPKENHFYGAGSKVSVNDVAVLNLAGPMGLQAPGGRGLVSTGVLVMYEDEESFSFITPGGHIFAALLTFSSAETEEGDLEARIVALVRASDPIYELGARMGVVHKMEDSHWHRVLANLASHFGVQGTVQQENILIDPKMQWSQAKNIFQNSAIHTALYLIASPFRWLIGSIKGSK